LQAGRWAKGKKYTTKLIEKCFKIYNGTCKISYEIKALHILIDTVYCIRSTTNNSDNIMELD